MKETPVNIKRKLGRPFIGEENKKDKFVSAAMTGKQFAAFIKQCAKAKLSPSDYIRERCLP